MDTVEKGASVPVESCHTDQTPEESSMDPRSPYEPAFTEDREATFYSDHEHMIYEARGDVRELQAVVDTCQDRIDQLEETVDNDVTHDIDHLKREADRISKELTKTKQDLAQLQALSDKLVPVTKHANHQEYANSVADIDAIHNNWLDSAIVQVKRNDLYEKASEHLAEYDACVNEGDGPSVVKEAVNKLLRPQLSSNPRRALAQYQKYHVFRFWPKANKRGYRPAQVYKHTQFMLDTPGYRHTETEPCNAGDKDWCWCKVPTLSIDGGHPHRQALLAAYGAGLIDATKSNMLSHEYSSTPRYDEVCYHCELNTRVWKLYGPQLTKLRDNAIRKYEGIFAEGHEYHKDAVASNAKNFNAMDDLERSRILKAGVHKN